jgi:hypothetical protein
MAGRGKIDLICILASISMADKMYAIDSYCKFLDYHSRRHMNCSPDIHLPRATFSISTSSSRLLNANVFVANPAKRLLCRS